MAESLGTPVNIDPLIDIERKMVRVMLAASAVFLALAAMIFIGSMAELWHSGGNVYLETAEKAVNVTTTLAGLFPLGVCKPHWVRLRMLGALKRNPEMVGSVKMKEYMSAIVGANLGVANE